MSTNKDNGSTNKDNGGRLCKSCSDIYPGLPITTNEVPKATTEPLNSDQTMETNQVEPQAAKSETQAAKSKTKAAKSEPKVEQEAPKSVPTGQPIEQAEKLIEALDLDPKEWSFGYEVKYTKGKWVFDLLLKNATDKTLNQRVRCGTIG